MVDGHLVGNVLIGQALSLAVTVTGSTSTALANKNTALPFFQTGLTYALLAATFLPCSVSRQWHHPPWKYLVLACMDGASTWCIVTAFSLTSITSVTLLDAWTVPCVVLLTCILFRQRYVPQQLFGAALAIVGLAILVLTDGQQTASQHSLLGDALTIIGASGYAATNVLSESLLHEAPPWELLAGLGLFGTLWSVAAVALTEADALQQTPWTRDVVVLLAAYSLVLFGFYAATPVLLHRGGSVFFNLSLLTSDFYAAAARVLFFGGFSVPTAVAFTVSSVIVVAGLVLFFTAAPAPGADQVPSGDTLPRVASRSERVLRSGTSIGDGEMLLGDGGTACSSCMSGEVELSTASAAGESPGGGEVPLQEVHAPHLLVDTPL